MLASDFEAVKACEAAEAEGALERCFLCLGFLKDFDLLPE